MKGSSENTSRCIIYSGIFSFFCFMLFPIEGCGLVMLAFIRRKWTSIKWKAEWTIGFHIPRIMANEGFC